MEDREDSWGSDTIEYFDLYKLEFSDIPREPEPPGVWIDKNIIPTLALENLLCRSDLKLDDYYGDRPLTSVLTTLRNYHKATNHSILRYYYGFLCIRCVTHVISLDILHETKALDGLLKSPDKNFFWKKFNDTMYREAMRQVSPPAPSQPKFSTPVLLEPIFQEPLPLAFVGGITPDDITFILNLLWEDRVSFFSLCKRGHFSGCTVLLFTIYQIILTTLVDGPDIRLLRLLDLSLRRCLVASHLERRILRTICLYAVKKSPGMDVAYLGEVVPNDSYALADTYLELLETFYDDDEGDLSVVEILYQYVSSKLRRDDSTQWRVWDILRRSMDFLWLVCSKASKTPWILRTSIWLYASLFFESTSILQREIAKTDEEKLGFAAMVEEYDLLALAGRTLLLTTERGIWSDNDRRWDWATEVFTQLRITFEQSTAVAPRLFDESIFTWAKVYNHINACYEMGHLDSPNHDLMMKAWWQLGTVLGAQYVPPSRRCAYPRCFRLWTNETVLGSRLTCGRCGSATYCDLTCQRAHWQLRTVDSHKLECLPRQVEVPLPADNNPTYAPITNSVNSVQRRLRG